jgi:hypothetical protein
VCEKEKGGRKREGRSVNNKREGMKGEKHKGRSHNVYNVDNDVIYRLEQSSKDLTTNT